MNWIFTYNLSTRTIFCVSILGYGFTWPHYARNLALWQRVMQNSYRKACSKTKHQTKSHSLYCVQRCCATFFTRTLSCSIYTIFKEKCSCKLNRAQCNLLKCTAKVVSVEPSRTYVYKEVRSGVLSDIFVTWAEPLYNLIAEKAKLCLHGVSKRLNHRECV